MVRKKVISPDEKPIWYEIYALHPPFDEARYDQDASDERPVRQIFYEEDVIRALVANHKYDRRSRCLNE